MLRAAAGDVMPPRAAEAGWRLWRVDLGCQTRCLLTVTQPPAAPPNAPPPNAQVAAKPLVLARNELTCVIRQEAVRFQAVFIEI